MERVTTNRRIGRSVPALVVCVLLLYGCLKADAPTTTPCPDCQPTATMQGPEGLAATADYVLVANTGTSVMKGFVEYGPGEVVVVSRKTRQVVGRVRTTQLNPQQILVRDQRAYVLCTGRLTLAASGLTVAGSGAGIDVLDFSAGVPRTVTRNIRLDLDAEHPQHGAPGSMVISPDERIAYLGSGTAGVAFKVDLEHGQVLRGAKQPIALFETARDRNGMVVLRAVAGPDGSSTIAMLSFNTEELCLSDDWQGDLATRRCGSVALHKELLSGPIDVVAGARAGEMLVLSTLANAVIRVDTTKTPFGQGELLVGTGSGANRLVVDGAQVLVVNSLSNNLERLGVAGDRLELPFAVFPVASNPFDVTVVDDPDMRRAYVSLYLRNMVAVLDATTGAVEELVGQASSAADAAVAPSDGGQADQPQRDAGIAADSRAPRVVGIQGLVRVSYGAGAGFGQSALPGVIQGGPQGGGAADGAGGSLDVLSLGDSGEIVVDFGDYEIVDGPGADFIVYENPFLYAPYTPYAEPALVGVSANGFGPADFTLFPCDLAKTRGDAVQKLWPYPGCAGVRPVYANVLQNAIDPTDPVKAGGDAFDLATIGVTRARYVLVRDAGLSPMGGNSRGFDLDAVVLIHYSKRK